jgi:hypothetical protein
MGRYYTTSLFIFSALGGIVTFMLISNLEEWPIALLSGAFATLGISIIIPLMFASADKKFIPLRKEIKEPLVIDERVNYLVGNNVKQGFMLATKESVFVISTDNDKPVKFEIKKSDIKKISVTDDIYLNIFLDYDKCIRVFAMNCEELSSRLQAEGFGK